MMSSDTPFSEILKSIREHEKCNIYDNDNTEALFRQEHQILDKYVLIDPFFLSKHLALGDIIRYSKSPDDKMSCAATIMKIVYHVDGDTMEQDKTLIDRITLQSMEHKNTKKYWDIFPSQYYIFKYFEPLLKGEKERIHKRLVLIGLKDVIENNMIGKKYKNVQLTKDANDNMLSTITPRKINHKKSEEAKKKAMHEDD